MKVLASIVMWFLTRYESYALETGRVPTVSWWQRGFPKWVRWASIAALDVYLFFDWELNK